MGSRIKTSNSPSRTVAGRTKHEDSFDGRRTWEATETAWVANPVHQALCDVLHGLQADYAVKAAFQLRMWSQKRQDLLLQHRVNGLVFIGLRKADDARPENFALTCSAL